MVYATRRAMLSEARPCAPFSDDAPLVLEVAGEVADGEADETAEAGPPGLTDSVDDAADTPVETPDETDDTPDVAAEDGGAVADGAEAELDM